MYQSVCKQIPSWRPAFSFSLNHGLVFLQFHNFSNLPNPIPKPVITEEDKRLFIINYLTRACGLSQEKAESASGYLKFKTLQRPDSVISFFKIQGFTSTQISKLVISYPRIIEINPDKIILPKIEFFRSLGLSTKDITLMLCSTSSGVLGRSLEKQIIPLFRYISTLLQSHENTLACIKRFCMILSLDLEKVLIPNVEYLGKVGVSSANVVKFVRNYPKAISCKHDNFRESVDKVISIGINPMKAIFGMAVFAFGWNSESSWRKKVKIYRSLGLSDADLMEAFRKYPYCMILSADNILKTMDFLVIRMGFEPCFIMKWPIVISFSLEKRITPRCVVYKALSDKCLIPKKFTLRGLLDSQEKEFLSTFVEPFESQVPGLLLMYKNNCPASK